jgi:hypothetical protein
MKYLGFVLGFLVFALVFKTLVPSDRIAIKKALEQKYKELTLSKFDTKRDSNLDFSIDKKNSLQAETIDKYSEITTDITDISMAELKKKVEQIDQHLESDQFYNKANKGFLSQQEVQKYTQLLRLRSELYKELISKKMKELEENI